MLGNSDTIETVRLRLVSFRPEAILGLIENPGEFESLFGWPAAPGLREFFTSGDVSAEFLSSLRNLRDPSPWHLGFAVLDREASSVVGSGGFKGPPAEELSRSRTVSSRATRAADTRRKSRAH